MRQNYSFSKNSNALLEPCEGKLSCTVLRGESPSNGADLLDTYLFILPEDRLFQIRIQYSLHLRNRPIIILRLFKLARPNLTVHYDITVIFI